MKRLVPIIANQGFFLVFGIVGVKILSHLVPPAVFGSYTLFLTLTQISVPLTHAGLFNHATRYWQREQPGGGSYVRFLWRADVRAGGWLALLLAAVCAGLWLVRGETKWLAAFPLLWLTNMSLATNNLANGILSAAERQWSVCLMNFVGSMGRAFLPALCVWWIGAAFFPLAIGYTGQALFVLLAAGLVFSFAARAASPTPEQNARWERELRDYGRPYLFMGVGSWLLQSADRWIVAGFFGEEQAGLFALAANLGAIVPGMTAAALLQLLFPGFFRAADAARTPEDWRRLARQCDQWTLLFLVLCVTGLAILSLAGPHLITLGLIGKDYGPAMRLLLPAGFAAVSATVNQFQYLLLQGRHNSRAMVKVMIVVSGVKTLGSVVAASISLEALLFWLTVSCLVGTLLGRWLIFREALREDDVTAGAPV